MNDEEIAALDLHGAASCMEVEGELPDMNAEEMAKEGFYLEKTIIRHRYRQGWRFLTLWEGFGVEQATWEPFAAFVLPEGRLRSVLVDYLSQNNLRELLRLAETLASKTKATRKFYSDFNTVFLLCLFCCLLLVYGSCCLFLMRKMFYC